MNIYIIAFLLVFTVFSSSLIPGSQPGPGTEKAGTAKIVFRSTDGGQTWQNISNGLPKNLSEDSIMANDFIANDKGLFLRVGDGLYHSASNAAAPFWTSEVSRDEQSSITGGKPGTFADNYWGVNLEKTDGTSIWSPIFEHLHEPRIRTVFETTDGTIFLGTNRGFFKTADNGKTWRLVHTGGIVGHLAESNGVLLAISTRQIIKSTDKGENWEVVYNDGGIAWDVKKIDGGFAAIISRSESETRMLITSNDSGKTWQLIDGSGQDKDLNDSIRRTWNDRVRLQAYSTSIIKLGENFLSIHPDGIFRSSDNGKTWKLLLPTVKGKVFSLYSSGKVIYAVAGKGGC